MEELCNAIASLPACRLVGSIAARERSLVRSFARSFVRFLVRHEVVRLLAPFPLRNPLHRVDDAGITKPERKKEKQNKRKQKNSKKKQYTHSPTPHHHPPTQEKTLKKVDDGHNNDDDVNDYEEFSLTQSIDQSFIQFSL